MFLLTLSKPGLKKLGTLALCGVLLAGTVAGVSRWRGRDAPTGAQPADTRIRTTQDIGSFFAARGFQVDLTSASVDKVKIPRQWDDSFAAFNQVVSQSGYCLDRHKGKTVEKWVALCPARSSGDQKTSAVLLVHRQKPVGAYLICQPGGQVTGLEAAAQTALPLDLAEQAAGARFGPDAPEDACQTAAPPQEEVQAAGPEPVD